MSDIKRYEPVPEFENGEFERIDMVVDQKFGLWCRYHDIAPLLAEREQLLADKQNDDEWFQHIMDETCCLGEVHCTCVPELRKRVREFEAERDTTPVDAEWLDAVMGKRKHVEHLQTTWYSGVVTVSLCEGSMMMIGNNVIHHPTRGDVLTALRLLGGRE